MEQEKQINEKLQEYAIEQLNKVEKPNAYENCLRAHAGECGTCSASGTFTPRP